MNKDGLLITIVDECLQKAREMHIETMDEFSQWIKDERYKLSDYTGLWGKYLFAEEKTVKFSELYQMFLETKKHE